LTGNMRRMHSVCVTNWRRDLKPATSHDPILSFAGQDSAYAAKETPLLFLRGGGGTGELARISDREFLYPNYRAYPKTTEFQLNKVTDGKTKFIHLQHPTVKSRKAATNRVAPKPNRALPGFTSKEGHRPSLPNKGREGKRENRRESQKTDPSSNPKNKRWGVILSEESSSGTEIPLSAPFPIPDPKGQESLVTIPSSLLNFPDAVSAWKSLKLRFKGVGLFRRPRTRVEKKFRTLFEELKLHYGEGSHLPTLKRHPKDSRFPRRVRERLEKQLKKLSPRSRGQTNRRLVTEGRSDEVAHFRKEVASIRAELIALVRASAPKD